GTCMGNRQAFFASVGGNADTFEHEMGHSLNLCHFITSGAGTGNCWKHHDHGYRHCKMGYNNKGPYTVPGVAPAIALSTGSRDQFCAKCLLKVAGWKEDVLPCKWDHPEVF